MNICLDSLYAEAVQRGFGDLNLEQLFKVEPILAQKIQAEEHKLFVLLDCLEAQTMVAINQNQDYYQRW